MKQAIGMIETKGLLALIEATDTMLKSSDVHCLGKKQVGGGINTVLVEGDVAAVETAVQAGIASVKRISDALLITAHVIPRPEIAGIDFVDENKKIEEPKESAPLAQPEDLTEAVIETIDRQQEPENSEVTPKEKLLKELQPMKVTELRKLAREQKNFSIPTKKINSVSKEKLIAALTEFLISNE